jgi:WD40 repeat protein
VREGKTRLNGRLVDGTVADIPPEPAVISVVTTGNARASLIARDRWYKDGRSWWGDIAEILIYNVVLSDAEVAQVEDYLVRKYGIRKWDGKPQHLQTAVRLIRPARTISQADRVAVSSVAFSPDGHVLATGGFDKTVKLWDCQSGDLIHTLEGHTDRVWTVTFSLDGQTLASGAYDRTLRLWEVSSGKMQHSLQVHRPGDYWVAARCAAFSPTSNSLVAVCVDPDIQLWDASSGTKVRACEPATLGRIWSIAFSPDGRILVAGNEDKTLRLWDMEKGGLIRSVPTHSLIWSVAVSTNRIAAASPDGAVQLWTRDGERMLASLDGHTAGVYAVAFSPDAAWLASAGGDKTVKLWEVKTGKLLASLEGHTDEVWSVAFSPDGATLASGGADGTVKFWAVAEPSPRTAAH